MEAEIDFEGLAALLKGARESRKKNLRDVAEECGVSASTLSRIERAQAQPDLTTISAVVRWIGVPLGRVTRGAEHAPPNVAGAKKKRAPTADTLGEVEVQFRADPKLSPQAAEALITIVRTFYAQMVQTPQKR
jgi:transcriptional regulator with XRE-family HTH domain